jgi:hypothetical protein
MTNDACKPKYIVVGQRAPFYTTTLQEAEQTYVSQCNIIDIWWATVIFYFKTMHLDCIHFILLSRFSYERGIMIASQSSNLSSACSPTHQLTFRFNSFEDWSKHFVRKPDNLRFNGPHGVKIHILIQWTVGLQNIWNKSETKQSNLVNNKLTKHGYYFCFFMISFNLRQFAVDSRFSSIFCLTRNQHVPDMAKQPIKKGHWPWCYCFKSYACGLSDETSRVVLQINKQLRDLTQTLWPT